MIRYTFKILQRMILNLIINSESARRHLRTLTATGLKILTLLHSLLKIQKQGQIWVSIKVH